MLDGILYKGVVGDIRVGWVPVQVLCSQPQGWLCEPRQHAFS